MSQITKRNLDGLSECVVLANFGAKENKPVARLFTNDVALARMYYKFLDGKESNFGGIMSKGGALCVYGKDAIERIEKQPYHHFEYTHGNTVFSVGMEDKVAGLVEYDARGAFSDFDSLIAGVDRIFVGMTAKHNRLVDKYDKFDYVNSIDDTIQVFA